MTDENLNTLLSFAQKIISIRPRSEKELEGKLIVYSRKRNISQKTVEAVISRMKENGFLNDTDFIRWWVDQRDYFKPKGKFALIAELSAKGIERKKVENFIIENKSTRKNDYDLALSIVEKKITQFLKMPGVEGKEKLRGFLERRGFDFDTVESVIDSMEKKFYNTNSKNH